MAHCGHKKRKVFKAFGEIERDYEELMEARHNGRKISEDKKKIVGAKWTDKDNWEMFGIGIYD